MSPTKSLTMMVGIVCLLSACSTSKLAPTTAQTCPAPAQQKPSPPKRGEPIDNEQLVRFLDMESANLLHLGRVATNLLQQPRPQTCALRLPAVPTQVLAPGELAEKVEMGVAVVGIVAQAKGKSGLAGAASGFFISESGALVTCWHVLAQPGVLGLTAMTRDGQVYPVRRVLAADPERDLVILQVEGSGFSPLPLAASVRQGAPVSVMGHPFPWCYMLTSGIASGYYTLRVRGTQLPVLDITADFANGSSGSPVFNENGGVVGVAKSRQTLGLPGTEQMLIRVCLPSSLILHMIQPESL